MMSSALKITEVITLSDDDEELPSCNGRSNMTVKQKKPSFQIFPINPGLPRKSSPGLDLPNEITITPIPYVLANGNKSIPLNGAGSTEDLHCNNHSKKRKSSEEIPNVPAKRKLVQISSPSCNSKQALKDFIGFIKPIIIRSKVCGDKEMEEIEGLLWKLYTACDPTYLNSSDFRSLIETTTDSVNSLNGVNGYGKQILCLVNKMKNEFKRFGMRKNKVGDNKSDAKERIEPQLATSDVSQTSTSSELQLSTSVEPQLSMPDRPQPSMSAEPQPSTSGTQPRSIESSKTNIEKEQEKCIKRLEKLLDRTSKKINDLENRELSLEDLDQEDSSYLRLSLLKTRAVTIWKRICKEKKCCSRSILGRRLHKKIRYTGTKYEELNKRVEKLINKTEFPDYADVLRIVGEVFEERKLSVSSSHISDLAREVFAEIGRDRKRRRVSDDEDILESYAIDSNVTTLPVENEDLKKRLDESAEMGAQKMQSLLDEFVQKQEQLKLEPVEVPDGAVLTDNEEENSSDVEEPLDTAMESTDNDTIEEKS